MLNRLQLLIFTGLFSLVAMPVLSEVRVKTNQVTSASDLLAQNNPTRVTGVEVVQTGSGLELILKTVAESDRLVPLILPEGNDLGV